jgi:transposase-like protein
LRNWVRRDDGPINDNDTSGQDGESLEAANARLRRENARLRRANEILKTASAFFAAAELDRQLSH